MNFSKFLTGAIGLLFLFGCSSMKNKSTSGKQETSTNQSQPKLTKPVARRIWVEPQVLENGSIYIEGHWKYVIEKESTWTN